MQDGSIQITNKRFWLLVIVVVAWTGIGPRSISSFPLTPTTSFRPIRVSQQHGSTQSQLRARDLDDFATWWSSQRSGTPARVRVARFANDTLRGLECLPKTTNDDSSQDRVYLTVPRRLCLWSSYPNDQQGVPWDVHLALQLWDQMSNLDAIDTGTWSGYCQILQGSPRGTPPAWTAPDALRHWTPEQTSWLASRPSGRTLLQRSRDQNNQWQTLYQTHGQHLKSYREFEWAMEAVYSRSFSGDFGRDPATPITPPTDRVARLVIAILSRIVGPLAIVLLAVGQWMALLDDSNTHEFGSTESVWLVVAILVATLGWNQQDLVSKSSSFPVAILVPFLDMANHLDSAQASVEYDSMAKAMTLTVHNLGTCLQGDLSGRQQLCISYGNKSADELLLNYGFLPANNKEGAKKNSRQLSVPIPTSTEDHVRWNLSQAYHDLMEQ